MAQYMYYIHFFVFQCYLFGGGLLIFSTKRNKISVSAAMLVFLFSLWGFSESFVDNPNTRKDVALIFENIGSICWIFYLVPYMWFVVLIAGKEKYVKLYHMLLLSVVPLVIFYQKLNGHILVNLHKTNFGWISDWESGFWTNLYFAYYSFMAIVSTLVLVFYYRRMKKCSKKTAIALILVISMISFLLGSFTNILLRMLGIDSFPPIGDIIFLFWVATIVYTAWIYNVFGITPESVANKIVSTMGDFLILTDSNLDIVSVNEITLKSTGFGKSDIKDSNIDVLFSSKAVKNKLLEFQNGKNKRIDNYETRLSKKDGGYIPVIISVAIEKYIGFVFIAKDITIQREAEHILLKDREMLTKKLNLQDKEIKLVNKGILFEIEAKRKIEKALQDSEEKFRSIFNNSPNAICLIKNDGIIVDINNTAEYFTGISKELLIGKKITDLKILSNEDALKYLQLLNKSAEGTPIEPMSISIDNRKGNIIYTEVSIVPVTIGPKVRHIATIRDISRTTIAEKEKDVIEKQFHEAQKMEAVGRLASGIAHDFNNIIGAISGYTEMLKKRVEDDTKLSRYTDTILKAASKAADLTKKLLTFARKEKYETSQVDLSVLVDDVIELLKHGVNKKIDIRKSDVSDNSNIVCDRSQIHNAILNIALNSKDAIGDEDGVISFNVYNKELDNAEISKLDILGKPGKYTIVEITDNGNGMSKEVKSRIFEPFFTTKNPGKGTGLGLASVYGIIKSHNAGISVESELGKGTTFRIYFRTSTGEIGAIPIINGDVVTGKGMVMIVDDETILLDITEEMLTSLGYTVKKFNDGTDAIEYFIKNKNDIDVVLLDMVMPIISGEEVFNKLKGIDNTVSVVIMSGFTKENIGEKMLKLGAKSFINKPFSLSRLSVAISNALRH